MNIRWTKKWTKNNSFNQLGYDIRIKIVFFIYEN